MIYILLSTSGRKDISDLFIDMKNLEQIAIPPCITEIGRNAFNGCFGLKQISIPSTCELIGQNAFLSCRLLKRITIPSSVKRIEDEAFADCASLEKVSLPSSLLSIGKRAFSNCFSLQQISIPFKITTIKQSTFAKCDRLKQVTLPFSLKSIEKRAFYFCSDLYIINIPSSVSKIGYQAFDLCLRLDDLFNYDDDGYPRDDEFIPGCEAFSSIYFFWFIYSLEFIFAFIWINRISPWFEHGYYTGKKVYRSLKIACISYILGFITWLLYSLFRHILINYNFRLKLKRSTGKLKKINKIAFIILVTLVEIIMMISGIIASLYALKNEKIDGKSCKCLKYIFEGYQGAFDWASNQSLKKQIELERWHLKMMEKAYKSDGNVSNYYCFSVGFPTLLFAAFPIYFIIFVTIITILRHWFIIRPRLASLQH